MSLKDKISEVAALFGAGAAVMGLAFGVGSIYEHYSKKSFKKSNEQIQATVLEERYENSLSRNPERNGVVSYSNETVKLDSKYTLKVRRNDNGKIMGVSIIDGGDIKKEAVDMLVEPGTNISFPRGNQQREDSFHRFEEETVFTPNTQVGSKRADRVTIE